MCHNTESRYRQIKQIEVKMHYQPICCLNTSHSGILRKAPGYRKWASETLLVVLDDLTYLKVVDLIWMLWILKHDLFLKTLSFINT